MAEKEASARRELEKKRHHFSKIIDSAQKREDKKIAKQSVETTDKILEQGDSVQLIGTKSLATVIKITEKKALLQCGQIQMETPLSKIAFVKKQDKKEPQNDIKIKVTKPTDVPSSIMIRHMTIDEATPVVEQYIDRAYRAGYDSVTIIHGHGKGILRRMVNELLKTVPYVAEQNLGGPHEGGYGVTIVKFAK